MRSAFALLALLLPAACGPIAASMGPQEKKIGDVTYTCEFGGGPFDDWSCQGKIGERIALSKPEFKGPRLTYHPFGGPAGAIMVPASEPFPIGDDPEAEEARRRWREQVDAYVIQVGEDDRFLVVHLSDDTWRLVERPAEAPPPTSPAPALEGPFTRAELDARLADAPMPRLLRTVDTK